MTSLEELFCSFDDFWQVFEPAWKSQLLGSALKVCNTGLAIRKTSGD